MSKYPYDDYCYECTAYGDESYLDENGEWVSYCEECPFNPAHTDEKE